MQYSQPERKITKLKAGKQVNYLGHTCIVNRVYPHIAYLKIVETGEVICVCLGDLVIAGLEPSMINL